MDGHSKFNMGTVLVRKLCLHFGFPFGLTLDLLRARHAFLLNVGYHAHNKPCNSTRHAAPYDFVTRDL